MAFRAGERLPIEVSSAARLSLAHDGKREPRREEAEH